MNTAPSPVVVDYYFSLISPYSWLGHATLLEIAREADAQLRYRPVRIFDVFDANGGLPLGKRAPARQRYRLVELQRWREARGLPLNLAPRFYPVDIALADRCAIALVERGHDPSGYMERVFRALWAQDRDVADRQVVAELLAAEGLDAPSLIEQADTDAIDALYADNTRRAISADLPGLPGYVLDGEPFWGQDRLDALRAALLHPRPPYRPSIDPR